MNRSKYQCNINGCHASFTRPWRLEAHIRVHQGTREFFCMEPDCGKAYFMQQHLKRHVATFHQRPVESKKSSANAIRSVESVSLGNTNTNPSCAGPKASFSCPVCSKTFKKHQQLKSHEYEHTGIKPFKCDKCDKSFLVSSKLKRHQKTHEGYRCSMDGCQEHYTTWSELLSHKSKAHKKTYQCETCNRSFLSKGNWRSHCLTHSTDRDRYKCLHPGCGRSYLRAVELDLHVLRVHQGVRETCQFDGCGKSFSCKAKLRRHARKHNPNCISTARNPKTRDDNSKKPRADKDVAKGPRKSMISVLCGLKLSYEENKKLIKGGNINLGLAYESDTDRTI